jgi:hypothetical protein
VTAGCVAKNASGPVGCRFPTRFVTSFPGEITYVMRQLFLAGKQAEKAVFISFRSPLQPQFAPGFSAKRGKIHQNRYTVK